MLEFIKFAVKKKKSVYGARGGGQGGRAKKQKPSPGCLHQEVKWKHSFT